VSTREGDRTEPPGTAVAQSPAEEGDDSPAERASRTPPPATSRHGRRSVLWKAVTLANVPILLLAGTLLVSWLVSGGSSSAGSPGESQACRGRAIAVLPFENLSGSDNDATLANGIHSDLITALSGIGALCVVSRAAVSPYREQNKPLRQIGEELNVDVLLEGSVQRLSDRLRVNVQLSDARTGRLAWADSYERELTVASIFVIQKQISERITASLAASLTTAERQRLGMPSTSDLSAYQYYHKAVETYAGTRAGNEEEERLLRMALHADPRFAPAWARLASNYGWRAPYLGYPISAWDSALAYHERALAIDPDLSGAYAVLALIEGHQGFLDRQERAAREAFRRDPSADFALRRLAESYREGGNFLEALRWHREALNRSPNALHHRTWIAYTYADLGEYDEAERWYRSIFQLEPEYHNALQGAALLNLAVDELTRPCTTPNVSRRAIRTSRTGSRLLQWWVTTCATRS
jgi:TolB-like protein